MAISVVFGIFITIATLPVILVIIYLNKSFMFSIIASFIYATIGFAITIMFSTNPVMMNALASLFSLEKALSYIMPYTFSTPVFIGIMFVYAIIFIYLATRIFKRIEI